MYAILHAAHSIPVLSRPAKRTQDDRTVLTNPHKGWYFHYIDNGMRAPKYRNTLKPGDDLKAYPGLNHMYLRFDWSDIEEERRRLSLGKAGRYSGNVGKARLSVFHADVHLRGQPSDDSLCNAEIRI